MIYDILLRHIAKVIDPRGLGRPASHV